MTVRRFEDLDCWKQARLLSKLVYAASRVHPFRGDWALVVQIRKASNSVMSNIAEGFERRNEREFIHFLRISKASVAEVHSDLYIALDEAYVSEDQFEAIAGQACRTARVIGGLIAYLRRRIAELGTRNPERKAP